MMYKSIVLNQQWACLFFLQTLMAMLLFSVNLENVSAIGVTPEIPTVSDNENDFMMTTDEKDEYGDYAPWAKKAIRGDGSSSNMPPIMVYFANPATMEELSNSKSLDANDDNIFYQKRGWKKMNVAWGKRRNAGQYMNRDFAPSASAAGTWGKREPNWNNLKGMWGKRASTKGDQWNYLRGSWGKRSAQLSDTN